MFGRSFRSRLTSFFIVVVILPMIAVAVVLFWLVASSERGKRDARLGQAQTAAQGVFKDQERRAAQAGRLIGQSADLAAAIEGGRPAQIEAELGAAARRAEAVRVRLQLEAGGQFEVGDPTAVAASTTRLVDPQGAPAGTLRTSVVTAQQLATMLRDVTGVEAVVLGPDRSTVASTLEDVDGSKLPGRGQATIGDRTYRVTSITAPTFEDPERRLTIRLLLDDSGSQSRITDNWLIVAGLLVAFLLMAFAFAILVSRSLQAQIQRLLDAARRLGGGELSVKVPTEGSDEFAALGDEFNAMARQLEARLVELENERTRLQHAIRRVGESFAKGLDREAVLRIVVQTAVDGAAAESGRASVRAPDGDLAERARVGDNDRFHPVLHAAEAAVLEGHEPAEATVGEMHALSHPLHGSDEATEIAGVISIARNSRPFSDGEKDLFNYLASQAAVSIENVDLHETVQRQAVTDELTGLFNHRRFQEVIASEVERAKRYDQSLGLIMLDLDDFKSVNDVYGHLQGDQVLREVARVLRESSREIDEPARYGGEEMVVALPQTDLEGAVNFAERVRQRIEALEIPLVGDQKGTLRVTASFGAAAMPETTGADKDGLIAAADSALYRAKRLGKNRVVKAG